MARGGGGSKRSQRKKLMGIGKRQRKIIGPVPKRWDIVIRTQLVKKKYTPEALNNNSDIKG